MTNHDAFITKSMAARPLEATIVRKVVRALKASGNPVVAVDFGEGVELAPTETAVLNWAFNLDDLYLVTRSGAWVRLIMGEGTDILCDYNVSLEDALAPVNDWIDEQDN